MRIIYLSEIKTLYDGKRAVGMEITHARDKASAADPTARPWKKDLVVSPPLGYTTAPAHEKPLPFDNNTVGIPLWQALELFHEYKEWGVLNRIELDMLQFCQRRPLLPTISQPDMWSIARTDGFLIEFPFHLRDQVTGIGTKFSLHIGSTNQMVHTPQIFFDGHPFRPSIQVDKSFAYMDPSNPLPIFQIHPIVVYTEAQDDVIPTETQLRIDFDDDEKKYVYAPFNVSNSYHGYYSYFDHRPAPLPDVPIPPPIEGGGSLGEPAPHMRLSEDQRKAIMQADHLTLEEKAALVIGDMPPYSNSDRWHDLFFTMLDDINRPVLMFFLRNLVLRDVPKVRIWNNRGYFPQNRQDDLWNYTRLRINVMHQEDTLRHCSDPRGDEGYVGRPTYLYKGEKGATMGDYSASIIFASQSYGWYQASDCVDSSIRINGTDYDIISHKEAIAKAIVNIMREIDGRDRLLDIRGTI